MADGLMAGISPMRMMAMETPRLVEAMGEMGVKMTTMLPWVGAVAAGVGVLAAEWFAVMGGLRTVPRKLRTRSRHSMRCRRIWRRLPSSKKSG